MLRINNNVKGVVTELEAVQGTGDIRLVQKPVEEEADQDRRIIADYSYRPTLFSHLWIFLAQQSIPIPYRDSWEEKVYNGNFEEGRAGNLDAVTRFELEQTCEGEIPLLKGKENEVTERIFAACNQLPIGDNLEKGKSFYPFISDSCNLSYFSTRLGKEVITLGKREVLGFFEQTILDMFEHRGHDSVAGILYKNFKYDKFQ